MLYRLLLSLGFLSVSLGALAYNLKDETILKYYQRTSRLKPSLWHVKHKLPNRAYPIEYDLIVRYPQSNKPPRLTFLIGSDRLNATITQHSSKHRTLTLKQDGTDTAETWTTPLPFGTFDFFSTFPRSPEVLNYVFQGLESQMFSGNLKITSGEPVWVFHSSDTSFPYQITMKRHQFFPKRIQYDGARHQRMVWTFHFTQFYLPAGPIRTEFRSITFHEEKNGLKDTHITWTFLKRLGKKTSEELTTAKRSRVTSDLFEPLLAVY